MYNNYTANRKAKEKKQIIIGAIVAVVVSIIAYLGFGSDIAKITACDVTSKMYVTAEYAERDCDFDGDCTMEYTSEPASDVWTVRTYNNKLTHSDVESPLLTNHGYYTSKMPPHDNSLSREDYFTNFKKHKVRTMRVNLNRNGEADHFSKTASYNKQCNLEREEERVITVKTWYGISYNTSA
jgi:hypothetical protein